MAAVREGAVALETSAPPFADPTGELPTPRNIPDEGVNFDAVVTSVERDLLLQSLVKTGGNKMRAALTTLGIVIGIAAVIATVEIGQGVKAANARTIAGMGANNLQIRSGAANSGGTTLGVDLSPNMAARTQRTARHKFPAAQAHCQAVDARHMPFRNESFDAIFCCYLLELLSADDIVGTLGEFRSGLVAAASDPVTAVLLGGVGAVAVVALWTRLFPDLAHIKSVAPESPPG